LDNAHPWLAPTPARSGYGDVGHAVIVKICQDNATRARAAAEPGPVVPLESAVAIADVDDRVPPTIFSAIFSAAGIVLDANRQIQLAILVEIAGIDPVQNGIAARIALLPRVERVSGAHLERAVSVAGENRERVPTAPTGESQIQLAVIVEVAAGQRKRLNRRRSADRGLECAVSISQQHVNLPVAEVGDGDIQLAIFIKVADHDASGTRPAGRGNHGRCTVDAVAFVEQHAQAAVGVRDYDVQPSVASEVG